MLRRAPRSRLPPILWRRKHLENLYNELYLPWLCPSLYTRTPHARPSATISRQHKAVLTASLSRKPVSAHDAGPCANRRGLASAVSEIYSAAPEEFIPFVNGASTRQTSSEPPNPHVPLVIDDSQTTAQATFKSFNAISGELAEIHQTLHACLQVGRFERATALMRRLNQIYKPDAPGLLAAHNEYIREFSWWITKEKDQRMLKELQRWFEVYIRNQFVKPNATTYAFMIQASLQGDDQKSVSRAIKRYLQLSTEDGLYEETVAAAMALVQDDQFDRFVEVRTERPFSRPFKLIDIL